MTIDKSKTIVIPVWLISVIMSLLVTGFTTWGVISATKATLEVRTSRTERDIELMQKEKADRIETAMVMEQLKDIKSGIKDLNKKLDDHISNK